MGTFVVAGSLADRIGRRPVILAGMLISALSIMPVYSGLLSVGNPTLATVQITAPVSVHAAPTRFDPFASATELDDATRARDYLAKRGISYSNAPPFEGWELVITVRDLRIEGFDRERLQQALADAGYPDTSAVTRLESISDLDSTHVKLIALILIMIVGAGLTCGPGATFLAEVFPTRIRYTALSVPYHITSAWFGGFMPLTAAWLVARSGDVLAGLWYPVAVMGTAFVLALWIVPETRGRSL
jgi:hypothetical protein